MRAIISLILLVHLNYCAVSAENNHITHAICTNSSNVIFVCGNQNPGSSSVKNVVMVDKSEGADSPISSFENLKVENQLSEDAKVVDDEVMGKKGKSSQGDAPQLITSTQKENAPESRSNAQPLPSNVQPTSDSAVTQNNDLKNKAAESETEATDPGKESAQSSQPTEQVPSQAQEKNIQSPKTETAKNQQIFEEKPESKNEVNGEEKIIFNPNDGTKTETKTKASAKTESTPSTEAKIEAIPEAKTDSKPEAAPGTTKTPAAHTFNASSMTFECIFGDAKVIETHQKKDFFQINYQDCHFLRLPLAVNPLSSYKNLRLLNVSNVGLQCLEEMKDAPLLETLIATHNNLTDIRAGHLINLISLTTIDVSSNHINKIDPLAFANLANLKYLNLSWNNLHLADPAMFANLSNLQSLDLSHNKFTQNRTFDDELFGHLSNLEELNLSNNLIKRINSSTFIAMKHLRRLDLSSLGLDNLEPGTFSNQLALKTLNLANNTLKKINFALFHGLVNLTSINLNGNQLPDLEGFKSDLLPKLKTFGITGNQFNCTYLETFFKSIEVTTIDFTNGQPDESGDNIHGVSCKKTSDSVDKIVAGKLDDMGNDAENVSATMKISMLLLCITLLGLATCIVAIRYKLNKSTGQIAIYELTEDSEGRRQGKAVISS